MTYDFAAALVRGLGGHVRQVRVDRKVLGVHAATVEVEGPLEAQVVDACPSDALNLAAITEARVLVSSDLVADFERPPDYDSTEARLLRLALTVPYMRIARATQRDLPQDSTGGLFVPNEHSRLLAGLADGGSGCAADAATGSCLPQIAWSSAYFRSGAG